MKRKFQKSLLNSHVLAHAFLAASALLTLASPALASSDDQLFQKPEHWEFTNEEVEKLLQIPPGTKVILRDPNVPGHYDEVTLQPPLKDADGHYRFEVATYERGMWEDEYQEELKHHGNTQNAPVSIVPEDSAMPAPDQTVGKDSLSATGPQTDTKVPNSHTQTPTEDPSAPPADSHSETPSTVPGNDGDLFNGDMKGAAQDGLIAGGISAGIGAVVNSPSDENERKRLEGEIAEYNRKYADAIAAMAQQAKAMKESLKEMGKAEAEQEQNLLKGTVPFGKLPEKDEEFFRTDAGKKVLNVRVRLAGVVTKDPIRQNAIKFAKRSADLSEESYNKGKIDDSQYYADVAWATADIIASSIPLVAFVKDGVEFATGYNAITGKELTLQERTWAGVTFGLGCVTMGFASNMGMALRLSLPLLEGSASKMLPVMRALKVFNQYAAHLLPTTENLKKAFESFVSGWEGFNKLKSIYNGSKDMIEAVDGKKAE